MTEYGVFFEGQDEPVVVLKTNDKGAGMASSIGPVRTIAVPGRADGGKGAAAGRGRGSEGHRQPDPHQPLETAGSKIAMFGASNSPRRIGLVACSLRVAMSLEPVVTGWTQLSVANPSGAMECQLYTRSSSKRTGGKPPCPVCGGREADARKRSIRFRPIRDCQSPVADNPKRTSDNVA